MNRPPVAYLPERPSVRADNCELTVRQEPETAKVVLPGREKDRKHLDPPPIVQLQVNDDFNHICSFLSNPWLFCSCTLFEADEDRPKIDRNGTALYGQTVSTLWKLKDLNNAEGGFFVYPDLSIGILGTARLQFNLYTQLPESGSVQHITSVMSRPFIVDSAKDWGGVKESTVLSRAFADQGVRLRLRKESRNATHKRSLTQRYPLPPYTQPSIRPHPPPQQGQSWQGMAPGSEESLRESKRIRGTTAVNMPLYAPTGQPYASEGQIPYGPAYGYATYHQPQGYEATSSYPSQYSSYSQPSQTTFGGYLPSQSGSQYPEGREPPRYLPSTPGSGASGNFSSYGYGYPPYTHYGQGRSSYPTMYGPPQSNYAPFTGYQGQNPPTSAHLLPSSMQGAAPARPMADPNTSPLLPPIASTSTRPTTMPSAEGGGSGELGGSAGGGRSGDDGAHHRSSIHSSFASSGPEPY